MPGRVRVTADGAVLTSGKPVRLFSATIKSLESGSGVATFHNGTAATDAEDARINGIAGTSPAPTNFGACGKFFPDGLYVDLDADVQYLDLDVELVQA